MGGQPDRESVVNMYTSSSRTRAGRCTHHRYASPTRVGIYRRRTIALSSAAGSRGFASSTHRNMPACGSGSQCACTNSVLGRVCNVHAVRMQRAFRCMRRACIVRARAVRKHGARLRCAPRGEAGEMLLRRSEQRQATVAHRLSGKVRQGESR